MLEQQSAPEPVFDEGRTNAETAPRKEARCAITCATLIGVEAILVDVEVDLSGGLPQLHTVGLAEGAVREARVRVRSAIGNSGVSFPNGRIHVNLAPANLRKDGSGFDFAIALGILAASGEIAWEALADTLILGELSLQGDIRGVRGVLSAAEAAKQAGLKRILVAPSDGPEAALVSGLEVRTAKTLADALNYLQEGTSEAAPIAFPLPPQDNDDNVPDLADVRGQYAARRALEVAAAGGHHVLFVGGPGSGKTMLARRLAGILPPLTKAEAIEVTRVHSAAGLLIGGGLVAHRPFRAPHHSTTPPGLVGGGSGIPRPGELTLAHRGVLFLDELPEFARPTLEALRQPLESGVVTLSRAAGSVNYPTRCQLVAAMNPCPCGHARDPNRRRCRCHPQQVARYQGRISGPLLDRIDLHVDVPPVDLMTLDKAQSGEASSAVRERVVRARERQRVRQGEGVCNADLDARQMRAYARPSEAARALLGKATERLGLSARSWDRVLRVARTIADLEGDARVDTPHVAEAIQYRAVEREQGMG